MFSQRLLRPRWCKAPACLQRFVPARPYDVTCSAACARAWFDARWEKRRQALRHHTWSKPVRCKNTACQQLFRPGNVHQRRFCSRRCYLAVINVRPALIERRCGNEKCGAIFRRTAAAIKRTKRSFCSRSCFAACSTGDRAANWRGGSDPNRGDGWRKLAEEMRRRDGYVCQRCGRTQEDNRQRLSVDHIVPWRAFTGADAEQRANDPNNLTSLCRSCHSKKFAYEQRWLRGDVLDMERYERIVRAQVVALRAPEPSKECTECFAVKPRAAFYANNTRNRLGLSSACKECHRRAANARYAAYGDSINIKRRDRYRARKEGLHA